MAGSIYRGEDLFDGPTRAEVVNAEAGLGMFTPGLKTTEDYIQPTDNSALQSLVAGMQQQQQRMEVARQEDVQTRKNALLAEQKRAQLEEAARLKAGEQYRKANPLRDEYGQLKQDSDLELRVKQGVNYGLDLWNNVNNVLPDFLVEDKTLDVDWRPTATIAGMAHEDLRNKDIDQLVNPSYTKKDVVKEANDMVDDPNGQGTLYYLKKNLGTTENPNYVYKVGFAQLNAADRYREQANAAGWDIVDEKQSSGSAELEKKLQTAFIGDRLLSTDQVKGPDGKWQSRDKASGIDFGSGYTEIYNKDILGWDKTPTKSDVNKYKAVALKAAVQQGLSTDELKQYRTTLDAITPAQLKQIQLEEKKARSYAKRDANDTYENTHYKDDAWTAAKTGLAKIGREGVDLALDVITPESMDRSSMLGSWLGAEKGNSTRLDQWKSQEEVDKYTNFNRRSEQEAADAVVYHYKKGDYVGALGEMFSGGALNITAESLGYMAPMLLGTVIATPFTGGGSEVAAAGGIAARVGSLFGRTAELKNAAAEATAIGDTVAAANAGKQISAASAQIESSMQATASTIQRLAKTAQAGGFYGQSAAMTNERIDQRVANNGGKPTTLLENAMVFGETVIENYVDRAIDLGVLGAADHKAIQNTYKMLDDAAKKNIATKIAAKAAALTGSAGIEGATEYIQNIGQSLSEEYDTKKNGGTVAGILGSAENQEAGLVNFLMGAAGGVHMQMIPSGISMAVQGGKDLTYKYGGGKLKDEELARHQALVGQIINGTVDPHNQPIQVRADAKQSPENYISMVVADKDYLPAELARTAIMQAHGNPESLKNDAGDTVSLQDTLTNIDKSLRTTFKIDENGKASDVTNQAKYEHALYQMSIETIRNIVVSDDKRIANLAKQGVVVDGAMTETAINNVMQAYGKVLPAEVMASVQLMTMNEVTKELKRKAVRTAGDNTEIGTELSPGKKGISVNIDDLKSAVRSMDAIIMGSMSSGSNGQGGGGFKLDDVMASLKRTKAVFEDAMKTAKVSNGKAQLAAEFFDQAKNASDVGSEVLFTGKKDNASGKIYGKGIYQHAEDTIDRITAAFKADGTTNKINMEPVNAWLSFAAGRVKARSVASEFKQDAVYTRKDVYDTKALKANADGLRYNYNYISEMDTTGELAKQKIVESNHMLQAARRAIAALDMATGRVSTDSQNEVREALEKIVEQTNADIKELEKIVADKESNGTPMVLVNLRNTEKHWREALSKKSNNTYADDQLKKVQARIEEAEASGKFGPQSPIYALEKAVKRKGAVADTTEQTYSGSEQQMQDTVEENAYRNVSEDEMADAVSDSESEVKEPVSDNTEVKEPAKQEEKESNHPIKKEEPQDGQNETDNQSDGKTEAPRESATSTEGTENDQPRVESNQKTDAGTKRTESVKDNVEPQVQGIVKDKDIIAVAEQQLADMHDENVALIADIAKEAGVEFAYDNSEGATLASNMSALRKSITAKVNEYKKSVKDEIAMHFTKADKLGALLTIAMKGIETGIRRIDKNDTVAEGQSISALKHEATFKGNEKLAFNKKLSNAINKTISDIETATSMDAKAKKMLRLRKLLNLLPDPSVRQSKSVRSKYKSYELDEDNQTWGEDDIDAEAKAAKEYWEAYEEYQMSLDAEHNEEAMAEQDERDMEQDPEHEESLQDQVEENGSKAEEDAIKKAVNLFATEDSGIKVELAAVVLNIKDVEAKMKEQFDIMVQAEVELLRAERIKNTNGAVISKDDNKAIWSEATAKIEKQMETC